MNRWRAAGLGAAMLLLLAGEAPAQVGVSETFRRTVEKIAKDRARDRVIGWISARDPVAGIVVRDLISQVVESRDEEQIFRSTVNVVSTLLFLEQVRSIVEEVAARSENAGILEQAAGLGWAPETLLAWSSLYLFYSERRKFELYVSPEILAMTDTKEKVESLVRGDGKKWVAIVSREYVTERRTDPTLDVRVLDLLQVAMLERLLPEQGPEPGKVDSLMNVLADAYRGRTDDEAVRWILAWHDTRSLAETLPSLWVQFTREFRTRYREAIATFEPGREPPELKAFRRILEPFDLLVNAVKREGYSLLSVAYAGDRILETLQQLFRSWLVLSRSGVLRFDYGVMLASTYLEGGDRVEFTALDQVRYGWFGERNAVFLFVSGFLDPLLKSTVHDEGARLYPVGVGARFRRFTVAVAAALPYEDVRDGKGELAISLGYEIPLADLVLE